MFTTRAVVSHRFKQNWINMPCGKMVYHTGQDCLYVQTSLVAVKVYKFYFLIQICISRGEVLYYAVLFNCLEETWKMLLFQDFLRSYLFFSISSFPGTPSVDKMFHAF